MSTDKVLISDYVHPKLITGLEKRGYTVIYDRNFPPERLEEIIGELTGIVINTKMKMTADRIFMADKLEFIARLGSGLDIIDLEAAEQKGIKVINTPEGNRDAVAEHAVGMLLNLANNLKRSDMQVRKGTWEREMNRGFELGGKTLGIVGLGNTGQSIARKLSCWGLEIIYNDPYLLDIPPDLNYLNAVELKDIVERSDIISLHVQLTQETKHLADEEFFRHCKPNAILINTSRGAVVDTKALIDALENGRIAGACLDVFENEKPNTYTVEEKELYSSLFAMENVVLSPHVAGWTHESLERIADTMLSKLDGLDD